MTFFTPGSDGPPSSVFPFDGLMRSWVAMGASSADAGAMMDDAARMRREMMEWTLAFWTAPWAFWGLRTPEPVGGDGPSDEVAPIVAEADEAAPAAVSAPAAAPLVEAAPALLDAPSGEPDDLTRIKGVGPKLNALLNSLGVWHYRQIASWTPAEVAWVNAKIDFPGRIEREGWQAQAAKLAEGSRAA